MSQDAKPAGTRSVPNRASNGTVLSIERLAKSGDGVAHLGGRTVFVEGGLPGEKVVADVSEQGRVLRGEIIAWLEKSPARRAPICALADRCGGCDWLHVEESVQRAQKEEIVLSALEHLGGFQRSRLTLLPTVYGAKALGYRRRAVLHPVGKRLGFFGRGSHEKVEVDRCPALTPALEAMPGMLALALGTALNEVDGVHLLEAGGKTAVSLHLKGDAKPRVRAQAERISRTGTGVVLVPKSGHVETFGKVELPDGEARVRPDGFAQANAEVNAKLVEAAVDALRLTGAESVLELYAGNGNFTFAVAKRAAKVVAVESSPVSVQLAQKAGPPKHVRFIQGDALKVIDGLEPFDRVLLDPPRTGAPGVGHKLERVKPSGVVYVACDPAALARDAEDLFGRGFRPVSLQLFDLFPQTRHIEAVLAMER